VPALNVTAVIAREACWPANITLSFAAISKLATGRGYSNRSSQAWKNEWFTKVDPSLHPQGTTWSSEEQQLLAEIKREGGSSFEAWRQLHRPPSACRDKWNRISKEYDFGPLTTEEQVIFVQALHELGGFNNQAIRDKDNGYLPRRMSFDIQSYWRIYALRLQRIILNRYNADESTKAACIGVDSLAFGVYFKQQNFKEADANDIVMELERLMAARSKEQQKQLVT